MANCVDKQIGHDLLKAVRIDCHPVFNLRALILNDPQCDPAAAGNHLVLDDCFMDQTSKFLRSERQAHSITIQPREVQQVINQAAEPFAISVRQISQRLGPLGQAARSAPSHQADGTQ
jgi:hypothetical protein